MSRKALHADLDVILDVTSKWFIKRYHQHFAIVSNSKRLRGRGKSEEA
jgi:hypothetical protein